MMKEVIFTQLVRDREILRNSESFMDLQEFEDIFSEGELDSREICQ